VCGEVSIDDAGKLRKASSEDIESVRGTLADRQANFYFFIIFKQDSGICIQKG